MLEQIAQIRILLALVNDNMQAISHENESLRKEIERLQKENEELKNKKD
jgi:hypothetical protein|nr:MAG TPA: Cell cycle protein [Bacteriophage sp.]